MCRDAVVLDKAKLCFASSCSTMDKLTALNKTSITCNEPILDKSMKFRMVNIVLFVLAVLSVILRWSAYAAVGRMHWLDEANMAIVLVGTRDFACDYFSPSLDVGRCAVCSMLEDV